MAILVRQKTYTGNPYVPPLLEIVRITYWYNQKTFVSKTFDTADGRRLLEETLTFVECDPDELAALDMEGKLVPREVEAPWERPGAKYNRRIRFPRRPF